MDTGSDVPCSGGVSDQMPSETPSYSRGSGAIFATSTLSTLRSARQAQTDPSQRNCAD